MCILADQQTSRIIRVVKFRNSLCSETSLNALLWKIMTTRMSVRKILKQRLFFKIHFAKCTLHMMHLGTDHTENAELESNEFMEEQCYLWWLHVHNACCSWSIRCWKKLWIHE